MNADDFDFKSYHIASDVIFLFILFFILIRYQYCGMSELKYICNSLDLHMHNILKAGCRFSVVQQVL